MCHPCPPAHALRNSLKTRNRHRFVGVDVRNGLDESMVQRQWFLSAPQWVTLFQLERILLYHLTFLRSMVRVVKRSSRRAQWTIIHFGLVLQNACSFFKIFQIACSFLPDRVFPEFFHTSRVLFYQMQIVCSIASFYATQPWTKSLSVHCIRHIHRLENYWALRTCECQKNCWTDTPTFDNTVEKVVLESRS